jgi:hypothetical protein
MPQERCRSLKSECDDLQDRLKRLRNQKELASEIPKPAKEGQGDAAAIAQCLSGWAKPPPSLIILNANDA